MRNIKALSILCLAAALLGAGNTVEYEWDAHLQTPAGLSKDAQRKIADCAVAKINTPDLRVKLVSMFPDVPKEWIQGIRIEVIDTSRLMDYPRKGIEVHIHMPSSKEAYVSSSPVMEYLKLSLKDQIEICSSDATSH